ncbi:hypothetical protein E2C01_049643 [Portunus trituberculatus]|uniref:Uncharacterized protein n=1 Tax=Portunus trituberculatus TaxID=210409 RepID=A0A5B7G659_PORTR|nr:hypothetical protein [Portunus trituberculatus]
MGRIRRTGTVMHRGTHFRVVLWRQVAGWQACEEAVAAIPPTFSYRNVPVTSRLRPASKTLKSSTLAATPHMTPHHAGGAVPCRAACTHYLPIADPTTASTT